MPVAAGLALGLAGVPVVQRLVASQLFGVPPFDTAALIGALCVLTAAALAATLIPAARALRLDPLTVMKGD
jgi:ABC-type antimicrobial peptide transport system permease subunit